MILRTLALGLMAVLAVAARAPAAEWESALAGMPLASRGGETVELNRTNCVSLLLTAFQSNNIAKALVFMPGATDELYMFRRVKAVLTNNTPTLWDAIVALTNQTHIHATFRPPMVLLHTAEDPLDPLVEVRHPGTAEALRKRAFLPHTLCNDRDWDWLQPVLKKWLRIEIKPWKNSYDSWHFYRHSFAGWNLTGWEALEATALAGKTCVSLTRNRARFELDRRFRTTPQLERFPE